MGASVIQNVLEVRILTRYLKSSSLVSRPSHPNVCRLQYFPRVNIASDKCWGEKAWYEARNTTVQFWLYQWSTDIAGDVGAHLTVRNTSRVHVGNFS